MTLLPRVVGPVRGAVVGVETDGVVLGRPEHFVELGEV